jgi:hypothetical protein
MLTVAKSWSADADAIDIPASQVDQKRGRNLVGMSSCMQVRPSLRLCEMSGWDISYQLAGFFK